MKRYNITVMVRLMTSQLKKLAEAPLLLQQPQPLLQLLLLLQLQPLHLLQMAQR